MAEKKATDLLLEMSYRLDEIKGYCKNLDFTNKIILERLKNIENSIPSSRGNVIGSVTSLVDDHCQNDMIKNTEPIVSLSVSDTPAVVTSNGNKIAVQQQVLYESGKFVTLAVVDIHNEFGKIKSVRTDASGKWKAFLEPNTYSIKIHKNKVAKDKPEIDKIYDVEIRDSEFPIELDKITV